MIDRQIEVLKEDVHLMALRQLLNQHCNVIKLYFQLNIWREKTLVKSEVCKLDVNFFTEIFKREKPLINENLKCTCRIINHPGLTRTRGIRFLIFEFNHVLVQNSIIFKFTHMPTKKQQRKIRKKLCLISQIVIESHGSLG